MTSSRRDFLIQGSTSVAGLSLLPKLGLPSYEAAPEGFIDLTRRAPDSITVQHASGLQALTSSDGGHVWRHEDVVVRGRLLKDAIAVSLEAPRTPVRRVRFRWNGKLAPATRVLGDAWERGYGDLEWRGIVPDRVMPWYCATIVLGAPHAYGVRTRPHALCFWQVDGEGITLWADVRSGAEPLRLGERTLELCQIVCRAGRVGESAFTALHDFCRIMCPAPRMPAAPVYGSNDWYWAYGKNSAASVRVDAQRIVDLSPTGGNRPFAVIDDGWQPGRGATEKRLGYWDEGNDKFGDMGRLAAQIRETGARPGIWCRPLQAPADAPDSWRLSRSRESFDPTVPDVLNRVSEDIKRLRVWGYELIKHDYTTWELFGRWGLTMGSSLTKDGWTFAEGPKRTTAEVINDLYRTIRVAADDGLIIGCNTVSHLSAGVFDICRIGDDTSGTEWPRTRKMGVNSLAYRAVQHGAFYVADGDCAGVTNDIPWKLNRQWLDLLARSGTMLMVSMSPELSAEKIEDLKIALRIASTPQALGEPIDWLESVYPTRWRLGGRMKTYDWVGTDGAELP